MLYGALGGMLNCGEMALGCLIVKYIEGGLFVKWLGRAGLAQQFTLHGKRVGCGVCGGGGAAPTNPPLQPFPDYATKSLNPAPLPKNTNAPPAWWGIQT